MTATGFRTHLCSCDFVVMIFRPEDSRTADMFREILSHGDLAAVMIADQDTAICPKCGLAFDLPIPEELDIDRSEFGQWLVNENRNRNIAMSDEWLDDDDLPF